MNIKLKILLICSAVLFFVSYSPKPAAAQFCQPGCSGCNPSGYGGCSQGYESCWDQYCDSWSQSCCGGGGTNPYAPDIAGTVHDYWGTALPNIEIDWTDSRNPPPLDLRKRWTDAGGGYNYISWVSDCGGYPWPDNPYYAALHNQEYGSYPNAPWWSNTNQFDAYSQHQNPHTIAPKLPNGWFGAFYSSTNNATNFDITVGGLCDPAKIIDFIYKPTPYGSIGGPSSGQVGVPAYFSATGTGPGMGRIQLYWAPATSTLSNPAAWNLMNQTNCDGSTSCSVSNVPFTPPAAGYYYITVNAYANFAAPGTLCSGNPWIDTGQITGVAGCNTGYSFADYIYFYAGNPVNGAWGNWSACSATCRPGGTQTHYCDSPAPAYGGLQCLLADGVTRGLVETRSCNTTVDCPVPADPPIITTPTPFPPVPPETQPTAFCISGSYSGVDIGIRWTNPPSYPVSYVDISNNASFSPYSYKYVLGSSSTTAPSGFSNNGIPLTLYPNTTYYTRLYNGVAANGGHSATVSFGPFPNCPVNGGWNYIEPDPDPDPTQPDWGTWGPCSVTCGVGDQNKTRYCNNPPPAYGGLGCLRGDGTRTTDANNSETVHRQCNTQACSAILKTTGGDVHANQ